MAEVTNLAVHTKSGKGVIRTIRIFTQGLSFALLWCIALFCGAGQIAWHRGWIAVGLYFVAITTTGFLVRRRNPGLLERRVKWIRTDTKPFDRLFLRLLSPLALIQPAVAGFDAIRFGWSFLPGWTVYPGIVLFILSAGLINWVMVKNPHAETSVRIQAGHRPVTSGPYRIVRHPMYAGSIAMYAAKALVLGSIGALGIAALIAILFLWRTCHEDQTLCLELPGYREYTSITPYRLVPGIW